MLATTRRGIINIQLFYRRRNYGSSIHHDCRFAVTDRIDNFANEYDRKSTNNLIIHPLHNIP